MIDFARQERAQFVALCAELGPDAPTLCEGWSTHDLAAHLVVRDRRPDSLPGLVTGGMFAAHTERLRRRARQRPYAELLDALGSGPPLPVSLPALDEQFNTHEFFIHHEDVRRMRPGWQVRTLSPEAQRALWLRTRLASRSLVRPAPVGVKLDAPGFGTWMAKQGEPEVTVSGEPGELLLFAFGRAGAAHVGYEGPAEAVARLRGATLGF